MTTDQITYLVFGIVLLIAVIIDLGLVSKSSTEITIKKP
jgi:tellurite resistance protein TerC